METLIKHMLESANLAAKRADTGNMSSAAYWYDKASYWASRCGDDVAAVDYMSKSIDCEAAQF